MDELISVIQIILKAVGFPDDEIAIIIDELKKALNLQPKD